MECTVFIFLFDFTSSREYHKTERRIEIYEHFICGRIERWENGTRLPDAAMLSRLSKVLSVDVSSLLW